MGRKRSAMRSPMPTNTTMASTPTVLRCRARKPEILAVPPVMLSRIAMAGFLYDSFLATSSRHQAYSAS